MTVMRAGLEFNIVQGYRFLAEHYEDGDEVYVLGFSRGAYTARSLAGMIRNCGLIQKGHLVDVKIAIAYGIYRTREEGPDSWTAKIFRNTFARQIPIKFVGVWDTVGALGIPLELFKDFNAKFYEFHDTRLSKIVENGYQAIAIDEHRKIFDVCLWNPETEFENTVEQRWFVGSHGDVGGGYKDRRLTDLTLRWMQDKAAALGLALEPVQVAADACLAPFADSYAQFLDGLYAQINPPFYRTIGATHFGNEIVDESARKRYQQDKSYRPKNSGF